MNDNPIGSGGSRSMNPFWRANDPNGLAANWSAFSFVWQKTTAPPANPAGQPLDGGEWNNDIKPVASVHTANQVGLAFSTKLVQSPRGTDIGNNRASNFYTTPYSEGYDYALMWGLGPLQHTKHDICVTAQVSVWSDSTIPDVESDPNWNPTIETYTLEQYLNNEIDGVPLYRARPFIAKINVKPFIRKGTQVGGSDITDSTPRVAYKSNYGDTGGTSYAYYRETGVTTDKSGGLSIIATRPDTTIIPYWATNRNTSSSIAVPVLSSQLTVSNLGSNGVWSFGWGTVKRSCKYNEGNQLYREPPTTTLYNKTNFYAPMNVNSAYAQNMFWTNAASITTWGQFNYIAWYKGPNIIQLMNSLGLDWAENETIAANGNPGDTGYHVPAVNEGGEPTGDDETDPDKLAEDEWNGGADMDGKDEDGNDPVNDENYEPTPTPPPGGEGIPEDEDGNSTNPDDPTLPSQPLNSVSDVSGQRKFVMTLAEVTSVRNYLNASYQPTDVDLTADFKGRNPFDYIVSLKLYPFLHNGGTATNVVVGTVNTGVSGKPLQDGVKYLDFGYIDIPAYFGNFLDYEPYTTIRLTVPYCGSIELDPSIYVGHRVALQGIVDYNTGAMTAVVFRDGYQMETLEGVACVDLPLFGTEQGDYQNSIYDAQFALRMAKMGEKKAILGGFKAMTSVGGGSVDTEAATGGGNAEAAAAVLPIAANTMLNFAGSALNLSTARTQVAKAEWDLNHTAPRVGTIGSASSLNNCALELTPRLTITRAKFIEGINVDMYGRTVGYACLKTGTVGSFSGFTQFADVKFINSTMLASERDMVRSLLSSGIIV